MTEAKTTDGFNPAQAEAFAERLLMALNRRRPPDVSTALPNYKTIATPTCDQPCLADQRGAGIIA